jgi:hypothetical protein
MKTRWFTALGLVTLGSASALGGCSDDPSKGAGSAGSGGSGGSGGATAGTSSAGSLSTSGNASGGSAGSAAAGSATSGSSSGGTAGAAGSAGAGGTAGSAGGSGEGGSGEGGEGGATDGPTLVYDFETDAQGWASEGEGVVVTTDAAQKVTGEKSLKVTVPALAPDTNRNVAVTQPLFWPGTVLTLHVYSPAGTDGLWLQAYTQSNNWDTWDTAGNAAVSLVRGGWTTLTYTVPETFPGGLQALGIQLGVDPAGVAFAGGDFYIDSITAQGGTESCTGTGEGSYGFETDLSAWTLDGTPTDTVIAQSTDEANTGTGSLKVSFTALPAGTVTEPTSRRIRIEKPVAYCTQEVTLNVWMPPGSESILFQGYAQFDNYAGWNAAAPPAAITRDGWTEQKYTLPAIGAGGLQLLGVQIMNTGEETFTGDVYIDDVSW